MPFVFIIYYKRRTTQESNLASEVYTEMFKKLIFLGLTVLLLLSSIPSFTFVGVGAQGTTASDLVIWANEGGDKVTQDEYEPPITRTLCLIRYGMAQAYHL